jgi:hypothetical protein
MVAGLTGAWMSSPSQPAHLSNHQRNTLRQVFQHPAGHNIEWRAVLSLLEAVGSAEEQHGGKIAVTIGSETEYFDPPPQEHRHPGSCQPAPDADQGRLRSRRCGCRSQRPDGLTLSNPHERCQAAGRTRPSGSTPPAAAFLVSESWRGTGVAGQARRRRRRKQRPGAGHRHLH